MKHKQTSRHKKRRNNVGRGLTRRQRERERKISEREPLRRYNPPHPLPAPFEAAPPSCDSPLVKNQFSCKKSPYEYGLGETRAQEIDIINSTYRHADRLPSNPAGLHRNFVRRETKILRTYIPGILLSRHSTIEVHRIFPEAPYLTLRSSTPHPKTERKSKCIPMNIPMAQGYNTVVTFIATRLAFRQLWV